MTQPSSPSPGPRHGQALLLCIDDDLGVLEALKMVLERAGYSVLTASRGRHGLELLSAHPVDLVVLDYEMPCLNGLDAAREIKRRRPDMPIIMNSGAIEPPPLASSAVDAFLHKGQFSLLLETIETLLGGGQDSIAS